MVKSTAATVSLGRNFILGEPSLDPESGSLLFRSVPLVLWLLIINVQNATAETCDCWL